ncbi:ubiquinol-cytochrome c reductase iron-sulfur subunit N-terminal domain-containing protein [Ferruginivarius sediminum]|uniref:Formate dehydrogenase n=1 Tax=Ferruginivarius sediminum TaxID=2661937 RepID=A0A369TJ12_9PROT|nr:ubiquinol-cytochrome c reductase iron-sulfur subunit N-terminal domain-containing protein [Ferruginivarius sediminum]RDD62876.1 formate dehydrogenase [Ferruginivarius sediminum]
MKDKEAKSKARRDFFRKAGLGAGALGAAAAGLGGRSAEAAIDGSAGKKTKGYRETAHVKKYYELARF